MNNPELVIMAAGLGSRFGGLKQLEPVGPHNQIIMDYSVYDAVKAGFGKVVFVINKQLEDNFREFVLPRYENQVETRLVFQEPDGLPAGFSASESRKKPWGTGHALLVAEDAVTSNFCVINADDFYGFPAFRDIARFLRTAGISSTQFAMAGYRLKKTLSPHGPVSRGACRLDENGYLEKITEHTQIQLSSGEITAGKVNDGIKLNPKALVSMNCWGFTPSVFGYLHDDFKLFLAEGGTEPDSEFQLPTVVDRLVQEGLATVKVLDSRSGWFGITYKEDLAVARELIRQKTEQGEYPEKLWQRQETLKTRFSSDNQLLHIVNQFGINVRMDSAERIGSGHIHQTYQIKPKEKEHSGFILQQFNQHVFPDYELVMDNILMITNYLNHQTDFGKHYQIAHPVISKSGSYHHTDKDGGEWRLFTRISPGISFDSVPDASVAREAGCILGCFLAELRDFPVQKLQEVIPGFHSVNLRYEQLGQAVKSNRLSRLDEVREELQYAEDNIDAMRVIPNQQKKGNLPVRVTHNDTKLNNILFDEANRAVAVIDLDTVMPGLSLFDFGDLVRTAATTGPEDSTNLSFSPPLFSAIAQGYLGQTKPYLTPKETELLPVAPQYMAFIMGIRFLADYLNGDIYYAINYPKHNYDRARSQFRLMKSMMEQYEECAGVIAGLTR